jgi:hypothetical protein
LDASEYQTIIRLSVTILVGILTLVIIILVSRWLIIRKAAIHEELDSDQLKLEMEALAERRKKEREKSPEVQEEAVHSEEISEDENGFIEGQPL